MKRIATILAFIFWAAHAHACLLTTGIGSCSGPHPFINTPTTIPLSSTSLPQSNNTGLGSVNYGLAPQFGTTGPLNYPSTPANSFTQLFEVQIDGHLSSTPETLFENVTGANGSITLSSVNGTSTFLVARNSQGGLWNAPTIGGVGTSTGFATYGTSFWPLTATTGGCQREPTAVFHGGVTGAGTSDPGFNCPGGTAIAVSASGSGVPGSNAPQTTAAPTCALVNGLARQTFTMSYDPGYVPGQTFKIAGFTSTPTGFSTPTYTVVSDSGTALVATSGGANCTGANLATSGGTVFTATAVSTLTWTPPVTATTPFTGQTGVQAKAAQRICLGLVQYGADSKFPGAMAFMGTDTDGNSLPGSPAFLTDLNQGTAVATGYLVAGSQGTNAPALHITSMVNPAATISSWAYSGTTGYVTFIMSAGTGYTPGSEFTVSGSSGGNGVTYVAVDPSHLGSVAYQSSTTIVGNPVSGPMGSLQANNPGASGTGGSVSSVLMQNMTLAGSTVAGNLSPFNTGGNGPFGMTGNGTNGSTGTPATYAIIGTPGTALGAPGSAVTLFFYSSAYFTGSIVSPPAWGGTIAAKSLATMGNSIWSVLGSGKNIVGTQVSGWGGNLGIQSMLYGAFQQDADGSPDLPAFASLCKKQTDIQTYAAAQGIAGNTTTVNSLYVMDDPGMWGDSSLWYGSGWIDTITGGGTGGTFHSAATRYGTAPTGSTPGVLSGPGIPGCPLACPTMAGTALTWATAIGTTVGSSGSPTSMKAGTYKPLLPIASNPFNGYIDNGSGSTPTLHVTSIPNGAAFSASLGSNFSGYIDNGCQAAVTGCSTTTGHTLTVTTTCGCSFDEAYAIVGIGTVINIPGTLSTPMVVDGAWGNINPDTNIMLTGNGWNGTYHLSTLQGPAQIGSSGTPIGMFGNGVLPGNATALMITPGTTPTGTIGSTQRVTDGNVNIAGGDPLFISGAGTAVGTISPCPCATWAINPTYLPLFSADAGLIANNTILTPGQYIHTTTTPGVGVPNISTPVEIIGAAPGFDATVFPQNYLLSNAASNGVGSSGTPVAMGGTGMGDGGAAAPGPALTIRDIGPGVTYPISSMNCPTDISSCTGAGSILVRGTFDTSVLGGKPATVQGSVSYTPNGPTIAGCSACAFINLTSYVATLSSGTVWNWSGTLVNIPPSSAPLFITVRASNDSRISAGTAYATMPSYFKVGLIYDIEGEGEVGAWIGKQMGWAGSWLSSLWGINNWSGTNTGAAGGGAGYYTGPPVTGSFNPASTILYATDLSGILVNGGAYAEGPRTLAALIAGATQSSSNHTPGWSTSINPALKDGSGSGLETFGNVTETQSIGVGDGSTTTFCSSLAASPIYCVPPTNGSTGPLFQSAGLLTGATIANASITNAGAVPTLTVIAGTTSANGVYQGTLVPSLVLSSGLNGLSPISGNPTLSYCISGCGYANYGLAQTWAVSCTGGCAAAAAGSPYAIMRAEPPTGPAPMSSSLSNSTVPAFFAAGTAIIGVGSFVLTDNGVTVCTDTGTFTWTVQSGTCTAAAGFTVTSSFINYITGDYYIALSSAPPIGDALVASWNGISSIDAFTAPLTSRPVQLDQVGKTTGDSGPWANMFAKTPGGVSVLIDGGYINDDSIAGGYPLWAAAQTQERSWYFGTKFPADLPGVSPTTAVMSVQAWRSAGAIQFKNEARAPNGNLFGQWGIEFATPSTLTGTITSNVLTLGTLTSGQEMWEGELLDCVVVATACPLVPNSQVWITGLLTGLWGAPGSTYSLNTSATVTGGTLQNALHYTGAGNAFYGGPIGDIPVQSGAGVGTGQAPHGSLGPTGARRVSAHWAPQMLAGIAGDSTLGSNPLLSRSTDANGCPATSSPCFDYSNKYAASHAGTWTSGGHTITITGGIAVHDRPFVVGQALTFSAGGGTGFYITSVSLPPSQDTRAGFGQVGQTFTFEVSNSVGGSASGTLTGTGGTVTAGCSPNGGGGGSQCINVVFKAGTTKGTYGTAWALATCGENNENGTAPNGGTPWGKCVDNGIGSLVRDFLIGSNQDMFGGFGGAANSGTSYDDGVTIRATPANGTASGNSPFIQSNAFTCNIVDKNVVQCVKGNVYDPTSHLLQGIGTWASGGTYVECCDINLFASSLGAVRGYVGGQPFPITTAGAGQTNQDSLVQSVTGLTATGIGSVATTCTPNTTGPNTGTNNHTVTTSVAATRLSGGVGLNSPGSGTPGYFRLTGFGASFAGYGTNATPVIYQGTTASTSTLLVGATGGASCPTSPVTTGNEGFADYGCGTIVQPFGAVIPYMDMAVNSAGVLVNAYPGSSTSVFDMGQGNGGVGSASGNGQGFCTWTNPNGSTPGIVTTTVSPPEGVGGIQLVADDQNKMGVRLRDNSGEPGNPLNQFFTNHHGGYFETGLSVRPFGAGLGVGVSN